jgi:hypothetical protein
MPFMVAGVVLEVTERADAPGGRAFGSRDLRPRRRHPIGPIPPPPIAHLDIDYAPATPGVWLSLSRHPLLQPKVLHAATARRFEVANRGRKGLRRLRRGSNDPRREKLGDGFPLSGLTLVWLGWHMTSRPSRTCCAFMHPWRGTAQSPSRDWCAPTSCPTSA